MEFGEWLQDGMTPEESLQIELVARREEPRTAMLYRLCCRLQQQLQQATNEIARLELELMSRGDDIDPRFEEMARRLLG
jgi:hypothetical protein